MAGIDPPAFGDMCGATEMPSIGLPPILHAPVAGGYLQGRHV